MTLTTANTASEELERIAFDRQTARLRTATPGIITAVHPNGTVDVQPAIMQVTTLDGVRSDEPLSVLTGVPTIFTYYAQTLGLSITLPMQAGDEGLLIVADRSIDNWQVAGGGAGGSGTRVAPASQPDRCLVCPRRDQRAQRHRWCLCRCDPDPQPRRFHQPQPAGKRNRIAGGQLDHRGRGRPDLLERGWLCDHARWCWLKP